MKSEDLRNHLQAVQADFGLIVRVLSDLDETIRESMWTGEYERYSQAISSVQEALDLLANHED